MQVNPKNPNKMYIKKLKMAKERMRKKNNNNIL